MNTAKQISSKLSSGSYMKKQGEDGFVLVVSLVLLIILALFGMFATRMATTEYQIAGNERGYVKNFYATESAVIELAQKIAIEEDLGKQRIGSNVMLLDSNILDYDSADKKEIENYLDTHGYKENSKPDIVSLAVDIGDGREDDGESEGVSTAIDSIKVTNSSTLNRIDIFARSTENGTRKIIKIGFKKRYGTEY